MNHPLVPDVILRMKSIIPASRKHRKRFTFVSFAVLSSVTVIVGMFGDLTESLIKRTGEKKDSGHLIPGHGGILDRIDSLIPAAPFFYYIALFYLNSR